MVGNNNGVVIVHNGKVTFFNAFHPLLGNKSEAEMMKELKGKRGFKFWVARADEYHALCLAKFESNAMSGETWDSGNLAKWEVDILESLVAQGKLAKRMGNDEEMTANGRPTIYYRHGA